MWGQVIPSRFFGDLKRRENNGARKNCRQTSGSVLPISRSVKHSSSFAISFC
jgi:hypothetical protein